MRPRLLVAALALIVCLAAVADAGNVGQHGTVTCLTTVTTVVGEHRNRERLILTEAGAADIHIGTGAPSALTTSNGLLIADGAAPLELVGFTGALSCISGGSVDLRYFEILK